MAPWRGIRSQNPYGTGLGFDRSKQAMGQQFKKAIVQGRLHSVMHVRLDNSPRRDIYKRI